ncbi:MAG TPA: spermidine/putrescine ABC transporter substrate-binding protein [Anaerolineales bacterium]|nr:spermidine/putrescine ABC transporter substrate-binding protein [Anaerolineales bacterium]
MQRRLIVSLLWISFLLQSCLSVPPTPTPVTARQSLTLYAWTDYIPPTVLSAFTAEYGIDVNYLSYASMEEAVAEVRAGGVYDVVIMENNNIGPLAARGLLTAINYQNIPNFRNVAPDFRDLAFDPNNRYSIPFDYGTTGLLVRSDLVSFPVTSWADLWDPRLSGKIAVRPLAYELIGMSLKSLGYMLNSENPSELEMALQHLLELRPSLTFVDDTTTEATEVVLKGEAVIMVGWGSDALMAREHNMAVDYILPTEGTILWGESFVIPATSPQQETAERFLNFLLRPEMSAQITNENHYATANQMAYPLVRPDLFNNPVVFPPAEMVKKSDWYRPLSPAGEKLYAEIWERFDLKEP